MVGFRNDGDQFLIFFCVILIIHYITVAFATLCVALYRDFPTASLLANLSFTFQCYSCGFFVPVNSLPVYIRWFRWVDYTVRLPCSNELDLLLTRYSQFYAFGVLNTNEFAGNFYDCSEPGGLSNSACLQYSGDFQLRALGIPSNWIWRPIVTLLGFFICFYLMAALVLSFIRYEIKMGKRRKTEDENPTGNELIIDPQSNNEKVKSVAITLEEYAIDVNKRVFWGAKSRKVSILKPISTTFEPGDLNIIM